MGESSLHGHACAIAIDDTEVCQRPLLGGFGVSPDFFQHRVESGVGGDGKIRQGKRKPFTGGLQKSFLARPAGKEARQAEMGGQRLKSGAFAERKKALGQ